MTAHTIAWLADSRRDISSYIESMEYLGFSTAFHSHAGPAIEDFLRGNKYSLIVVSPDIAPGLKCDDPVITRIMSSGAKNDYWKIGLRVVELTHSSDSANRETPIVVAGFHDPEYSVLCPKARETFLRAGATEYVNLVAQKFDFNAFHRRLEQLARKV